MKLNEVLEKLKDTLKFDEDEFNRELLQERKQDAKNALEDVLGYLKEFGEGDLEDIQALEKAVEVLETL